MVMIYALALLALFVWGPLIYLHGYRVWPFLTIYIMVAVFSLGGSIAHRTGHGGSGNLPAPEGRIVPIVLIQLPLTPLLELTWRVATWMQTTGCGPGHELGCWHASTDVSRCQR
jgi:hypothetical protein